MQCDCGKKLSCALRSYAQEYEINRDQYKTGARKPVTRTRYAGGLVHEPGKCIDCGRCIGITAAEKVQPGLAFGNRGFDVAVKAPFGADMDIAMGRALDRCVAACPVGTLWKETNGTDETYGCMAPCPASHTSPTSHMSHKPHGGAV
jgi:predicted molibdopterin-dependent oxidoreductase YjgC